MKKQFIIGFTAGALVFSAIGAFAVQYTATENTFPVQLNGDAVSINGFNIEGSTYFKLRDVAEAVGGFDVDFNNNTIQLSKDGYSYSEPTEAISYSCPELGIKFNIPASMTAEYNGKILILDNWFCTVSRFTPGDLASTMPMFYGVDYPVNTLSDYERYTKESHEKLEGQNYKGYINDFNMDYVTHNGILMRRLDYFKYSLNSDIAETADIRSLTPDSYEVSRYYTFELNGYFYEISFQRSEEAWSAADLSTINTIIDSISAI